MSLFDLLTFKKDAVQVFSVENIVSILSSAKDKIVEQAKEAIKGAEKKAIVDAFVIKLIREKTKNCKNKLVLWVVDRIIDVVPRITQLIYEFLKEKIENL